MAVGKLWLVEDGAVPEVRADDEVWFGLFAFSAVVKNESAPHPPHITAGTIKTQIRTLDFFLIGGGGVNVCADSAAPQARQNCASKKFCSPHFAQDFTG